MISGAVIRSKSPGDRGFYLLRALMTIALIFPMFSHAAVKTVCDGGCDHSTIKAAISDTVTGDTILLQQAKTYSESDLVLSARVLISTGAPAAYIINGSGCKNQVLTTGSGGVIEGVTITGCNKTDDNNGAGIVSNGDTQINNVIVTGNSTTGRNAGIWHSGGGTLTIRNSEITNNTAEGMPALSSRAANLKIRGLKVTGNTATGPVAFGSVSIVRHTGLTAHIVDLEISGNTIHGDNIAGGGLNIACNGGARTVSIFNSQIKNNTADGFKSARGGGVYITACTVDLVDTEVSGNELIYLGGSSQGGGFYTSTSGRDIRLFSGSTITGNSADSGGGVWCAGGNWKISGTLSGNTQADTDFVNGNNSCGKPAEVGVSQPGSGTSGDPVNTLTGELFDILPPDIELGGLLPLEFVRFYNSALEKNGYRGTLGRNWLHNFEYFFEAVTAENIEIFTPGGQLIRFLDDGNGGWLRLEPSQIYYQLVENNNEYILYDPDSRYFYTFEKATSLLTSIYDSNGNTHSLTYTGTELDSVSDGLGRTLSFTYDGNSLQGVSGGDKSVSFTQNSSPELLTAVDARSNTSTYSYKISPDGLLETAIRPETNVPFEQTWDNSSRVVTQTDALGNTFSFSYDDPIDGITTITNPDNTTTTSHTHDADGVLIEAVDEEGEATTIVPDSNNNRSGVSNALGNTTIVIYDMLSGYASEIIDGENNSFKFTYGPRLLANGITEYDLARTDYPDDSFELWQYDAMGNFTTYTDAGGNDWVYTYDAMGNMLTETNPASGVTTYTYLADGNLDTVTDPAGNTIDHDYDAQGRLILTKLPDGNDRQYGYDDNDNLLLFTDENGAGLTRGYDFNSNKVETGDGASEVTDLNYDALDRLSGLTPPVGNPSSFTYDSFGRLATMTGPDNNVLSYTYDSRGRMTALNDNAGLVWSATYDDAGRKLSQQNALAHTTTFTYDDADRVTGVIDAQGTVHQFSYDGMDRVISNTSGGRTTGFDYEQRGMVQTITLADGSKTQLTYNELGKISKVTDPLDNDWTFTTDSSGRSLTSVDPLGRSTSYEFDKRSRHKRTVFPAAMGSLDVGYDGRGQITTMVYSDGTNFSYGYDALDSLVSGDDLLLTRDKLGRVLTSNGISNNYNVEGMISKIGLAGGDVDYAYDSRGQLSSVQDWLGGQSSFSYDTAGRMLTHTHGNGLITYYVYNKQNAITSIEVRDGATVISRSDFVRDDLGQITSASRAYPANTPVLNLPPATTAFSFDTAMQTQAFSHDDMGRRSADNLHVYTWNLASRLLQYTADAGATTINLAYDGLGNIISQNDGGGARTYLWNYATTHACIAEITGGTIRYNVCAPDGRLLYSITTSNDRWHYHYDEMGNVQFVTNNAGNVLAAYRYSPFGKLLADSSNGSLDNPFTYQGRAGVLTEKDGLYVFQSRVYDSNGGRFLSRDPVTGYDPVTINPYQYAMNNPLFFVDPDGGSNIKAEDVFGAGVGAYGAVLGEFDDGMINKLEKAAAAAGKNTPQGLLKSGSAANAKRLQAGAKHLGNIAWVYSAIQEISSTNDKIKRTMNRQERLLAGLLSAYYGNIKSITELYKQKKISYHRWRAWMDLVEQQYHDGIDSAVSSGRLEIIQDSIEGILRGVGSVILPPSATDCMMKWMGRNVPPVDFVSDTITDWNSN